MGEQDKHKNLLYFFIDGVDRDKGVIIIIIANSKPNKMLFPKHDQNKTVGPKIVCVVLDEWWNRNSDMYTGSSTSSLATPKFGNYAAEITPAFTISEMTKW